MKARTAVLSKTEKRITANVKLLDEKWPEIIGQVTIQNQAIDPKERFFQYIVFHNGAFKPAGSFQEATSIGNKKFGTTAGFVIRRIT